MSKISLSSNASGTGTFTIASPNSSTDRTLTLPDQTGTVLTGSGAIGVNASAPASSVNIDSSGNVGIGTTSPSGKFHVANTGTAGTTADNLAVYFSSTNRNSNVYIQAKNTEGSFLNFGDGDNESVGRIAYEHSANYMAFNTNAAERMRIDSSGNLLIGQTNNANGVRLAVKGSGGADDDLTFNSSSTYAEIQSFNSKPIILNRQGNEIWIGGTTDRGAFNLQCNGTGVWGAGAYTNGSDERIKQDITPLDTGLDVVAKLNPVTYKYKEDWSKDQSIQTGFIAQDLLVALEGKNYVDGIVNQSSEYMSVAYQNIIPILTKAIQEQQTIIETLKADIAELKAKVNA